MKSQLFSEQAVRIQTSAGRWVQIQPDSGAGYKLFDLSGEQAAGRILTDSAGHWIYDGILLDLDEQEDIAGQILGYRREMDTLLRGLGI